MKNYVKYLITAAVGMAIAVAYALVKDVFSQTDTQEVLKILCDAFFIPAVFITSFGGLVCASNGGTFDMISYGVQRLFGLLQKDVTKVKHRTFHDYREERQKKNRSFGYLLVVGLAFLLVSIVFLIIYSNQ